MDLQNLLFRFGGRINRARYWIGIAAIFAFWLVVIVIIELLPFGTFGDTPSYVVLGAGSIGAIWINLALSAKRLHDRNKSAWWILLFWLLPAVLISVGAGIGMSSFGLPLALAGAAIVMWAFVEMGCLRGTEGQNAYGADPLPSA
jgi:uncharacterized membrane protein YhaH (DUF805 family)